MNKDGLEQSEKQMNSTSLRMKYFAGSLLFFAAVNQDYSSENGQER